MRILIACEYSGIIRNAFSVLGHDVWSCDLLPTETEGQHYQCDVREVITLGWDMLIAHPPCTYIAASGLHYCNIERYGDKAKERIVKRHDAVSFFLEMYNAPINKICVENPRGYISTVFKRPTQEIHPYYFGEPEMKRTGLWLKNLPPLLWTPQNTLFEEKTATERPEPYQIQTRKATGKVKNRYWTDNTITSNFLNGKNKSKSFQSIANAMAMQWG